MARHDLLMYFPVVALLMWAAVEDLYARRIPNWLTFSLALAGISSAFLSGQPRTPSDALLGFAVGFAVPFVLFALGALGGGDVKLLAALGAWLGPAGAMKVFVIAAIVGMLIVLTQAAIQRRTRVLIRNSTVVALNLIHLNDVGVEQAMETGQSSRSVDRPLPYAVPVLAATLLLFAMGGQGTVMMTRLNQMLGRGRNGRGFLGRRGGAVLETALVLPVLLSLSFGCVEYAHFFYVKHMMQGAAREGCRAGIVSSGTKTDVDTAITSSLTAASLQNSGYTTTVKLNGTTVTSLSTAVTGDTISVQVECNWGTVGVRPLGLIPTSKQVVGVTVMRRE